MTETLLGIGAIFLTLALIWVFANRFLHLLKAIKHRNREKTAKNAIIMIACVLFFYFVLYNTFNDWLHRVYSQF